MIRVIALHPEPRSPEQYDTHYRNEHMDLVRRVPGVRRIRVGRVVGAPSDGSAPFFLLSEVWFEDEAALAEAMASSEMSAAMADVPNFASDGITVAFCDTEDFPVNTQDAQPPL